MKGFQELEKKVNSTVENLLETKFRELTGKMVLAFGENGGGTGGRKKEIASYTIRNITVLCPCAVDSSAYACINIYLNRYDIDNQGPLYEDRTFMNSIKMLFSKIGIDPEDVEYAEQGMQGDNFVSMAVRQIRKYIV